jgi:hypothetical protein
LQQSENAHVGSFLSSNGGGQKKPLADSQLFAAKLKQFQDFFEQSKLNDLLTLQNFQPSSPTAN